jgi:hypothetical protein
MLVPGIGRKTLGQKVAKSRRSRVEVGPVDRRGVEVTYYQ